MGSPSIPGDLFRLKVLRIKNISSSEMNLVKS